MRPELRPRKLTRRSASPSGKVFRMMASVSRAGMRCRRADILRKVTAALRGNRAPVQNLITYHTRGMHGNACVRCAALGRNRRAGSWLVPKPANVGAPTGARAGAPPLRTCPPCLAQAAGIRGARTGPPGATHTRGIPLGAGIQRDSRHEGRAIQQARLGRRTPSELRVAGVAVDGSSAGAEASTEVTIRNGNVTDSKSGRGAKNACVLVEI